MKALVTGTDTNVGKTYVTAGLTRTGRRAGHDVIAAKPFCTGPATDVAALHAANETCEPEHAINPAWFHTPLAPFAAAMIEDRHIDLGRVHEVLRELASRHDHLLVEGAGGLAVPILRDYDFRDLAEDLELEVVLVAANRLGVMNHVRLTLEALNHRRLHCRAVVLNAVSAPAPEPDLAESTNPAILEQLIDVPLFQVAHGQTDFSALVNHLLAG
ncbi:MAG: dethiobiotin synthase [Verrucomicrobia bacterium]|nr:dethiobiotin synthase [Verrucomicrobiota bacterium]